MIVAFTRLHYGLDYLWYVIKSTEGFADRHVVMYTPVPTFGRAAQMPCPDSRNELVDIAHDAGGKRLLWLDLHPRAATVLDMYPEADMVLELDADEIVQPQLIESILKHRSQGHLTARQYRIPMIHHWRSFNYYCANPGWPGRLYIPGNSGDIEYFPESYEAGVIHHFGYARKRQDMLYKVSLSVHLDEWRSDWWETKYDRFPDVLNDVHPTCVDMWDALPYDKSQMPDILKSHPYYNLEVID